MQIPIRQRLVGAAVLVALAVIFLPMLFDGAGRRSLESDGPVIPPEPRFEPGVVIPAPATGEPPPAERSPLKEESPPAGTADEAVEEALAPHKEKVASALPEPSPAPSPAPRPATVAWVVQTGSFSDEGNAVAERDRLQAAGYSAFVEPYDAGARAMYRVKIGPELRRQDAEALAARLAERERIKGLVVSHP